MAKNKKKVYQGKKQVISFEQDDFNSQTSEDSEDNWLQDNDLDFGLKHLNARLRLKVSY